MKEPHIIPEDFSFTDATKAWLQREYPQIDADKTLELFKNKMANAIDYEKRSPYFGQQVHALNWQRKAMTYIRIAMVNKWASSVVVKQGHEIDIRWAETLSHAAAIGCPLQRQQGEGVELFRTRVKMWEGGAGRPRKTVTNFGDAIKDLKKSISTK